MTQIQIEVNEQTYTATLANTPAAEEFEKRLPITISMDDLHNNEKYYYFSDALPAANEDTTYIRNGDIKLYGDDCLVVFYQEFTTSYRYTSIGTIDDPQGLAQVLGTGSVQVTFRSNNHEK